MQDQLLGDVCPGSSVPRPARRLISGMSLPRPRLRSMELTVVQQRTLDDLLDVGDGSPFDPGLVFRLRDRISTAAAAAEAEAGASGVHLRLSKDRLNDHARCEGLFQAVMAGEREPFTHSLPSAAGTLLHKCVELEVG